MTPYTLHVRWASGREERIPVTELGAVIRVGPNDGREPQRIPIGPVDGPPIAVLELWSDEIPAIIVKREEPKLDSGEREPTKEELSAALLALMRALRAIQRGDSEAARAAIAEAESVIGDGETEPEPEGTP